VAIGEATERIAGALAGTLPLERAESLRDGVGRARTLAHPGDVVLLAPACSSFDMFRDYADRGRAFKAEVERLASREAAAGNPRG
jgi:UDP-N-acetylmuramoylalanine--D-glutamate ligase